MSFKNFASSQVIYSLNKAEKITEDKLKREYQLYKKDWEENQNENFVREHRVIDFFHLG